MRRRVIGGLYAGALSATALCALVARLPARGAPPACPPVTWAEDGAVTVQEDGVIVDGRHGEVRVTLDGRVHRVPPTDPRHNEALRASGETAAHIPLRLAYNPGPPEVTARRGDRLLRARVLTWFDESIRVRFDDGPARLVASAPPVPFSEGPLGTPTFCHGPHVPRGVWERLVPFGDGRWLFFWPEGLVTFDDDGHRLDGCAPDVDVDTRLRAAMPVVLAPAGPILVRLALGLGAASPLAWGLAALRRRRRLVLAHAVAWSLASLFALWLFALPLLT